MTERIFHKFMKSNFTNFLIIKIIIKQTNIGFIIQYIIIYNLELQVKRSYYFGIQLSRKHTVSIIVSSSNWVSTWKKRESDILLHDDSFSYNNLKINSDKLKCKFLTNDLRTTPNKINLTKHKKNCSAASCSCLKLSIHSSSTLDYLLPKSKMEHSRRKSNN